MKTGKCKKCVDTYIGDDYGPLKECSCGKDRLDKCCKAERRKLIEEIRFVVSDEIGKDVSKIDAVLNINERLTKLQQEGE